MKRQLMCLLFVLVCFMLTRAQQTDFMPSCAGTNDTAKFTEIIATIGSNKGTIKLPYQNGSRCAVNSLTIPSNVTLDNAEGTGIKINTGRTLIAAGPIVNPVGKQIFYNALSGQGAVVLSVATVFPEWWGAALGVDFAGPFNGALAALPKGGGIVDARGITGTLTAASTITMNKANVQVLFGAGSLDLSGSPGIDITADSVHLVGLGERATNLRNLSSGATVRITPGIQRASIHDLSLVLATTTPTAQGLLVKGPSSGLSPVTSNNYSYNIEIVAANGITANQIGLNLDATGAGGSVITFNTFYNFKIVGIDRPLILESHTEANTLFGFNIEQYGSATLGVGAVVNGHANQLTSFWFGRSTSIASELQGFSVAGDNNIMEGVMDGANGAPYVAYLFDFTGKRNKHSGTFLGTTTYYVKSLGNNPLFLGPTRSTNSNLVSLAIDSGKDQLVSATGVTGFSNCFTVAYQDAKPRTLRYVSMDEAVGLGVTPPFAGSPGPYTRVIPTASLPAASANNDGLIVIEDAGRGVRNLIFYSGGQRFRIAGGVPF